jgi:WD40 repeat protein
MFDERIRTIFLSALLAACLLVTGCVHMTPLVRDKAVPYESTFIASEVRGAPGTVDWSPDGKYLAYITSRGDLLVLYDPVSGEKRPLEVKDPFFVSWADSHTLLVVHGKHDYPLLSILDISSKKTVRYPLPPDTAAVIGEPGEHYAWTYIEGHDWSSLGVTEEYGLFRADWKRNSMGEIAKISRIAPIKPAGAYFLRGWAKAAPDPVSGKTVLLQLISPPLIRFYLKVLSVDTVTLDTTELMKLQQNEWLTTRASWSPYGGRLALIGNDNHLKVLSLDGELHTLDEKVVGIAPAWDPRGGRIFFGGYFIADDGSESVRVVRRGAKESTAFFSPGGDRMVLFAKGDLWLIKGIGPSSRAPETPPSVPQEKAASLRKLYRADQITKQEYEERIEALLQLYGGDPKGL